MFVITNIKNERFTNSFQKEGWNAAVVVPPMNILLKYRSTALNGIYEFALQKCQLMQHIEVTYLRAATLGQQP